MREICTSGLTRGLLACGQAHSTVSAVKPEAGLTAEAPSARRQGLPLTYKPPWTNETAAIELKEIHHSPQNLRFCGFLRSFAAQNTVVFWCAWPRGKSFVQEYLCVRGSTSSPGGRSSVSKWFYGSAPHPIQKTWLARQRKVQVTDPGSAFFRQTVGKPMGCQ